MSLFLTIAFLFFIGSMAGWGIEVVFRRFFSSANPERKWINPGFLVKCSKIVYRLCNHMVYSFDILKASQKKRKRWRWLGRKGLWK